MEAAAKDHASHRETISNDVATVVIWVVSKPIKVPEQRKDSSKVASADLLLSNEQMYYDKIAQKGNDLNTYHVCTDPFHTTTISEEIKVRGVNVGWLIDPRA